MSKKTGARVFPSETMGDTTDMDHEEFHDIDVKNNESSHKNCNSETDVSLICLFIKAEQSTFLLRPETISEIWVIETGNKPEWISPLNKYKVIFELPNETVVLWWLYIKHYNLWCDVPVMINCTMSTRSNLQKVMRFQDDGKANLNIREDILPSLREPAVWTADTASVRLFG